MVRMYHRLSNSSLKNGHLYCFQYFVYINNATVMNLLHVFLFFISAERTFWLKFPKEKTLWKRASAYVAVLDIDKLLTTGVHHFALKRRNGFEGQSGREGVGRQWRLEEDSFPRPFANLFAPSSPAL